MSQIVNWGILGAAKFARTQMAPSIHLAQGGRLAALATSSADKAAPFLAMAPDMRVHDSYAALLADPAIDAVYIPLPNHLHVEWSLKAIAAGKHVLCEKPMTLAADQFDALIAARDASGLTVAEAFMILHHPQWHQARDLVQGGDIGQLRRIEATFCYDNRADPGNIRNKPASGGGGMPDIGVYVIGAARFVTGAEPEHILTADFDWENDVDVRAQFTARLAGAHFSATVSMRMAPWQEVTFQGTTGLVRLTAPFNPQVFGQACVQHHRPSHSGGTPQVTETRYPAFQQYVAQVEAFNASVRGEKAFPATLEFAQGTQRMMDQVFAFEKGSRIS